MMTKDYRLGDYKIMESGTGELRWEAHSGLGEITEGRCFTKGSILFIGPPEGRRDGFLKSEFIAHIKVFHNWLETKYYCKGFEIYHCKTGKKATKLEMLLWEPRRGIEGKGKRLPAESDMPLNATFIKKHLNLGRYRLQRYEITVKSNNQIVWKTHAGPNTFSGGTCTILEDILFLKLGQSEKAQLNKRQFLANLEKLPEWHQTAYYCPKLSLHECKIKNEMQHQRKRWSGKIKGTKNHAGKKGYKSRTLFELKAPDLSKKGVAFLSRLAKKWLSCAAGWIVSTVPIVFAYLIRLWKKFKGRWHNKAKRSSIHRRDD